LVPPADSASARLKKAPSSSALARQRVQQTRAQNATIQVTASGKCFLNITPVDSNFKTLAARLRLPGRLGPIRPSGRSGGVGWLRPPRRWWQRMSRRQSFPRRRPRQRRSAGIAPSYGLKTVSAAPNAAAIVRRTETAESARSVGPYRENFRSSPFAWNRPTYFWIARRARRLHRLPWFFESNFPPDGVSLSYAVLWYAFKMRSARVGADTTAGHGRPPRRPRRSRTCATQLSSASVRALIRLIPLRRRYPTHRPLDVVLDRR
jgi:hypothetical protein